MESIIQLLVQYGAWGMFASAFLAGSILPFSSELVLVGLLAAGADPVELLLYATAGNTLGSLLNYGIGMLGREEWISRWTGVRADRLERGKRWIRRYGAWAGLLSWLPVAGEVIVVAMGYLRVNFIWTLTAITLGKFVRYWLIFRTYILV